MPAGVSAMRIGVQSVRLGAAIYLVPFCFVLNPALLLKGDPGTVAVAIGAALAGLILLAAALQGYVLGLGLIPNHVGGWIARLAMIAGGLLLAAPMPQLTGLPFSINLSMAAALAVIGLLIAFGLARRAEKGRVT